MSLKCSQSAIIEKALSKQEQRQWRQNTSLQQRYELGEQIGEGVGWARLFIGKDQRANRWVAIKQLKPEMIQKNDSYMLERFRREAEALRRLNHPNIVRVFGLHKAGDAYYIIMEYVPGGTLEHLIDNSDGLPIEQVLSIGLELSDALARAHHLSIIHRDIKSANVLIAKDNTPRLTDFGIAHIGDRSRVTRANTVMGTIAYLSPEALGGATMDTRTDIWAFGVLLYEMLTGNVAIL